MDEEGDTEQEAWQVYSFGKRNVFRLHLMSPERVSVIEGKAIPCRRIENGHTVSVLVWSGFNIVQPVSRAVHMADFAPFFQPKIVRFFHIIYRYIIFIFIFLTQPTFRRFHSQHSIGFNLNNLLKD